VKKQNRVVQPWIVSLAAGLTLWAGAGIGFYLASHPGERSLAGVTDDRGDNPYRFGTACPTQGQWTQAALENTRAIYAAVEGLLNNPACKGKEGTISRIVADFKSAEAVIQDAKSDTLGVEAETLPAELSALRNVVGAHIGDVKATSNLLFRKSIDAAKLASTAAATTASTLSSVDNAGAIVSLYNRTHRASSYGVKMAQQIFAALPTLDECLMGQPDVANTILSGAIKVGAAFSTGGEGLGYNLGSALATLTATMRDRRFTQVMRQLDQTELWFSISCLMEQTSKNYCEAENAREMLEVSRQAYVKGMNGVKTGDKDAYENDPLRGYYLLTRELPLIANWINQLKLGTDPRSTGDATMQKEAIERVNEYWKTKKDISGNFSLHYLDMMALPTVEARQQSALGLVAEMAKSLSSGAGSSFILQSLPNPQILPYYLIGLDAVPEEMKISQKNIRDISWLEWMGSGADGHMQPQFNDPVELARTLKLRIDTLLQRADNNANAFFRKRLVIDPLNLISLTLTTNSQNMTVFQAYGSVIRYLEALRGRLKHSDTDNVLYALTDDTIFRVKQVVNAYQRIMNVGRTLRNTAGEPTDNRDAIKAATDKIIDIVFEQFQVLYQSDAFLTNRISTLINRDFSIRIKDGLDMTEHQKDLMMAAQDHLVENIIQFHGKNITNAINDLGKASTINQQNLVQFEQMFADQLYLFIAQLNEIAHNRPSSVNTMDDFRRKLEKQNKGKARREYWREFGKISVPRDGWVGAWTKSLRYLRYLVDPKQGMREQHPELYERHRDENAISIPGDDRFGGTAQFHAELCIQTLAFVNRDRFYPICKDAVLKSGYTTDSDRTLEIPYLSAWRTKNPMPISEWAKKVNADPRLRSERVCAYNNYLIRNWVRFLQDRDRRNDEEETQGEYQILKEEREAREKFEKAEQELKLKKQQEEQQKKDDETGNGSDDPNAKKPTRGFGT
jgi:hypothetical protein